MSALNVSLVNGEILPITVEQGEALYVLGTKGTGKSSLLFSWASKDNDVTLVAANRTVIFDSAAVTLSAQQSNQYEGFARNQLMNMQGRAETSHLNNTQNLQRLLARLKALGEHYYREHFDADQHGDITAKKRIRSSLPDLRINAAMAAAHLPLQLRWNERSEFIVTKNGVPKPYGINQMSDGERSALILAMSAILAGEGTTIFLDEPDRHLHRAVSSPLLEFLRQDRDDLAWIIATHDLSLARDDRAASVLLLYEFDGLHWKAELAPEVSENPTEVADAIYGAREKVLFVEGDDKSLDKPLYSLFFPGTTVVGAGNCKDVQNAVCGLRKAPGIHHMTPAGVLDSDNRFDHDQLRAKGLTILGVYAVESIYYRSEVVAAVLDVSGSDAVLEDVTNEACEAISDKDLLRFARDASYKAFRHAYYSKLPSVEAFDAFEGEIEITPNDDYPKIETITAKLTQLRDQKRWDELIGQIKIKTCKAPSLVVQKLQYANRSAYEIAVRKVLKSRTEIVERLRSLIPDPFKDLATPETKITG